MRKIPILLTLILALLLTAGCAPANTGPDTLEANVVPAAAGPLARTVDPQTEPPTEPQPIGTEQAQAIALDHAGLSASGVTGLKAGYDREDGDYEVDFRQGDHEYDYTIHAYSGKVLSHDKEYDPVPTKSAQTPTEKLTEAQASVIGRDRAKSIALGHAGLKSGDVRGLECEYDVDDGVKEYEVDFRSGRYEYSYTIHAVSGRILSWEKEIDD